MNPMFLLAVACGALAGAGVWLILRQLTPSHPDLGAVLDALAPRLTPLPAAEAKPDLTNRVGAFGLRHAPGLLASREDLSITQTPPTRHLGTKILFAAAGLVFPVVLAGLLAAAGLYLPFVLPAGMSIGLALFFFFAPDLALRERAQEARADFARAVSAYVEIVALERSAASGTVQAMESAATVADTWAFQRLREQLLRARLDGVPPWTALADLADEVSVPELADFASTMRLAGEESAQVYATLRSQARSMRGSALSAAHAKANATSSSMVAPAAVAGLIFLSMLMIPAMMRLL
jgi:pilus assembly protein TadC